MRRSSGYADRTDLASRRVRLKSFSAVATFHFLTFTCFDPDISCQTFLPDKSPGHRTLLKESVRYVRLNDPDNPDNVRLMSGMSGYASIIGVRRLLFTFFGIQQVCGGLLSGIGEPVKVVVALHVTRSNEFLS